MKKFILFSMLLLSLGVFAKPYHHSLGISAGSFNGLSWKVLVKEHFAVQTDVGVHLTVFDYVYGSFVIQPMFMYQGTMYANDVCNIDFFAGGGLSFGFGDILDKSTKYGGYFGGEFGLNGVAGVEFGFNRAPLALSFDFRPGYGMHYCPDVYPYFDWGLSLGLRFYM